MGDCDSGLVDALRDVARAMEMFRLQVNRSIPGVGPTERLALTYLDNAGGANPSDLARRLSITTASATALVDRLVKSGFAVRKDDPVDRRKVTVELTNKGLGPARVIRMAIIAASRRATRNVPPEHRDAVMEFLNAVTYEMNEMTLADALAHLPGSGSPSGEVSPSPSSRGVRDLGH